MSSTNYSIEQARAKLGDLVTAAQQGSDIIITRHGKPAARIVAIVKESTMSETANTTTTYGTWVNFGSGELNIATSIAVTLGDYADEYDMDAIKSAYITAIDAALPGDIQLCGDEFIGPWDTRHEVSGDDIRQAIQGVDFWVIAQEHLVAGLADAVPGQTA